MRTAVIRDFFARRMWLVLIMAAAAIIAISIAVRRSVDMTEIVAAKTERLIDSRMSALCREMDRTLAGGEDVFSPLNEDMVIYLYDGDSLVLWRNQFTVRSDNIAVKMVVPRMTGARHSRISPLAEIDTAASYVNYGPNWYIVKARKTPDGKTVIGGLLVRSGSASKTPNSINKALKVPAAFSIQPISHSGGVAVSVEGHPLLKILQEASSRGPLLPDNISLWAAYLLAMAGLLLHVARHPRPRATALSALGATALSAAIFQIGKSMQHDSELFSPALYADGRLFYSLGGWLAVCCWTVFTLSALYILALKGGRIRGKLAVCAACGIPALLTAALTHWSLSSIGANSNISLELHRVSDISRFTLYVHIAVLALLSSVAALISVVYNTITSGRPKPAGQVGTTAFSIFCAIYLVTMTALSGYNREVRRMDILANRLAVERDIGFELRLRRLENGISGDSVIKSSAGHDPGYRLTGSRLVESHLERFMQECDVDFYICTDSDADPTATEHFTARAESGEQLHGGSSFSYSRGPDGRARYTGLFTINGNDGFSEQIYISIDPRTDIVASGYASRISSLRPGRVSVPEAYSYAKYIDGALVAHTGGYSYPTIHTPALSGYTFGARSVRRRGGYIHFISDYPEDETVVLSRRADSPARMIVSGILIALLSFMMLGLFSGRPHPDSNRSYYKSRINTLVMLSLVLALVTMASVSIELVYRRNNASTERLMTSRISTIRSLVTAAFQSLDGAMPDGVQLSRIAGYSNSDITIYSPDGTVAASSCPELYDRAIVGPRMSPGAFIRIVKDHRSHYIDREVVAGQKFYMMYTPVNGPDGRMAAIIGVPYTDSGSDLQGDAAFHALLIIAVFLLIIMLARQIGGRIVERMLRPLSDMREKMNAVPEDGLEYIIYEQDDEITSLVHSYNVMVHNLSEGRKRVATAERDRAWSEMARQVAHEIKNPLTPIKLQIQRIIRLKEKNDPQWEEKFSSIVPVIMESIDSLTDTANEFSTFAKLYSEVPVEIDLDDLVGQQVELFSGRSDISLQYFGLKGAVTEGPKPQLTRVVVNLLTNAMQAVEGSREADGGRVNISVRNSTREGFYDIVVEDNGPGVSEENRSRLFTPNFTTKSGGTGLGLAICKNILDRCGGEIFYSRSFTLGGACFTVRLKKIQRLARSHWTNVS